MPGFRIVAPQIGHPGLRIEIGQEAGDNPSGDLEPVLAGIAGIRREGLILQAEQSRPLSGFGRRSGKRAQGQAEGRKRKQGNCFFNNRDHFPLAEGDDLKFGEVF